MKKILFFTLLASANISFSADGTKSILGYDINGNLVQLESNSLEDTPTYSLTPSFQERFTKVDIAPTMFPILTANKRKGTLSVFYPETNETKVTYALFGRSIGNEMDITVYNDPNRKSNGITPAGKFTVEQLFSTHLHESMLVFIHGSQKVSAIHPLWMGNPDQRRPQRLRSNDPNDNRITNGCINVDPDFFYNVLIKIPTGSTLNILPD